MPQETGYITLSMKKMSEIIAIQPLFTSQRKEALGDYTLYQIPALSDCGNKFICYSFLSN